SVAVDRRVDDELVLEAVACDLEHGIEARLVLAGQDAVVVTGLAGAVAVEQADEGGVGDAGRGRVGDGEEGAAVALLVAVQAPADLVVGRDLADALEDLGVGEVAEDVAGEAEAVVQAAPEALAGPHRPAGQGHGLDAAAAEAIDLGLDLEVL